MIIFLYGADTYRSRQKLKELKERFMREIDSSTVNSIELDGLKFNLTQFKNSLTTVPFLAKKRMLIVENLIASKTKKEVQKTIVKLLKQNEGQNTIVIFWEKELSGEHKNNILYKNLILEKYVYRFDLLKDQKLRQWYEKEFVLHKIKITPSALNLLINLVGDDLWRAFGEIKKLSAYRLDKVITSEDISTLTNNKLEENIFILTDALGQKNKKLALGVIQDFFVSGLKAGEILNKITWQFKNLLMAKSYLEDFGQNITSWELSSKLQMHPFVAKKILAQVKNYQMGELKKIYLSLVDLDFKLKTSALDARWLLDLFVVRLRSGM